MKYQDPEQLQRLVDGELDYSEIRRLLRYAEAHSEAWREIASAFVEDQLWKTEFVNDQERPTRLPDPAKIDLPDSNSNGPRGGLWWMSLAAATLLALSLGFLVGESKTVPWVGLVETDSKSDDRISDIAASDIAADSVPLAVAQHRTRDRVDLNATPAVYHHMQLEDETGNQFLDSDVPLYATDRSSVAKRLRETGLPDSVRQRAADSGYQMQQNIRFLSGKFKDGRKFVIPVRKYSFSPIQ